MLSIANNATATLDAKDNECLMTLFVTDPRDDMERTLSQNDKLLEDSGAWVLGYSEFSRWLHEDTNSVLWLHGDPGKGKTMLTISLAQELVSIVKNDGSFPKTGQAYFFCDNKDSRRKNWNIDPARTHISAYLPAPRDLRFSP